MGRVAVIVIDAAEPALVERLLADGTMPNLARLRARSATCRVQNEIAYRSELPWRRFITGRDPAQEGLWAPAGVFEPDTYASYAVGAPDGEPFYAFGERHKAVVFDLIHSTIEDGVEGAQVTAWGAHSPQYPRASRPAGLLGEIDSRFGPNPVFGNDFDIGWFEPAYIEALGDGCVTGASRRAPIFRFLQDRFPDWDLFVTCMSEVHSAGHHFWHGVDERHPLYGTTTSDLAGAAMRKVMRATDDSLGDIVDALPEGTAVVVAALHGMQPADDLVSTVLLPELLLRRFRGRRLLRDPDQEAWRRAGCPPARPAPGQSWHAYMKARFADGAADRLRLLARRALPDPAYEALRRAAGKPPARPLGSLSVPVPPEVEPTEEERAKFSKPFDYQVVSWYQRYWPSMPAFALPSFADGHIRVNLAGRERDGVVAKEDYGRVCDDLVRLLGECRDVRTGEPVVREVLQLRRRDPYDPTGPDADLLVLWEGAPDALEHPELGTVGPYPHLRTSAHSPNGFAYLSGPGIEPGDLGVRHARDLTPTVIRLLGDSPAPSVQGQPLVAASAGAGR